LPTSGSTVSSRTSTRLAEVLDLESTPFALEVERGTVTRKAYLHAGASDLIGFVDSRDAPPQEKGFVKLTEKEAVEGR
jgi:hypothetical protein